MIQKEEGRTEYEKISSVICKVIEEGIKKINKKIKKRWVSRK